MARNAVSIVIATRNCLSALQDAEERWSAVAGLCEIVVQDGASTDGTTELLYRLCSQGVITSVESEQDSSTYDAWNRALPRCSGDWVLFYGDGDIIPVEWVQYVGQVAPGTADVIVGRLHLMSRGGRVLDTQTEWNPSSKSEVFNISFLPHVGMAHSRLLLREHRFDTQYQVSGDREMLLRAWPLKILRHPVHTQGAMILGGVSNSLEMLKRANAESALMMAAHGLQMTRVRFLKGQLKNWLSKWPAVWRLCHYLFLRIRWLGRK
jgi:glycosyltransferase involved in cell wall biosynthesis